MTNFRSRRIQTSIYSSGNKTTRTILSVIRLFIDSMYVCFSDSERCKTKSNLRKRLMGERNSHTKEVEVERESWGLIQMVNEKCFLFFYFTFLICSNEWLKHIPSSRVAVTPWFQLSFVVVLFVITRVFNDQQTHKIFAHFQWWTSRWICPSCFFHLQSCLDSTYILLST